MLKKLAAIGNSYGVIIDRPLLREAGISPDSRIELLVVDGAVVIRPAPPSARRPRRSAQPPGGVAATGEGSGREVG